MPDFCQLPLRFDPQRLQADLEQVPPEEWVAHYNTQDYEGDWAGAALRSVGGRGRRLYADPAAREPFADTQLLGRCPYLRELLAQLQCPLQAVRLLRLKPGARVREHCDHMLGLEYGEARLHVPVTTNPDVDFVVNGQRLAMNPGETWYINFTLPHRVHNRGTTDRIHLVIDCHVTDWLRGLLPAEEAAAGTRDAAGTAQFPQRSGSPDDLERLRRLVLQSPMLEEELRKTADRQLFVSQVVRLGEDQGCNVTAMDVEEAMRATQRAWLERGIGG